MSAPPHPTATNSAVAVSSAPASATAPATYTVQYNKPDTDVNDAIVPVGPGNSTILGLGTSASPSALASTVDASGTRNAFWINNRRQIVNLQKVGNAAWTPGPFGNTAITVSARSSIAVTILLTDIHIIVQTQDNRLRRYWVSTTGGPVQDDYIPATAIANPTALTAVTVGGNSIHIFYQTPASIINRNIWDNPNRAWSNPSYTPDTFYARPGTGLAAISFAAEWRLYFHDSQQNIVEVGGGKPPVQVDSTEADLSIAAVNLITAGTTKHVLFKVETGGQVVLNRAVTTDDDRWVRQPLP